LNKTIYSNSERSEQFLVTECFFNLKFLVPGGFSDLKNRTIIRNSNWKKLLGFRNLQEKLEKYVSQRSVDILNINKIEFMIPFSPLSLLFSHSQVFNFLKQKHHYLSKNIALLYFTQIEQKNCHLMTFSWRL